MTGRRVFMLLLGSFICVSPAMGSQALPANIKSAAFVVHEVPPRDGKMAPMPGHNWNYSTLDPGFSYGKEITPIEFLDKRTIALRELPSWYCTSSNLQKEIVDVLDSVIRGRGLNPMHTDQTLVKEGISLGDITRGILDDGKADVVVIFHYFLASDWQGINVYSDPYPGNKYNYSSAQATRSGIGIWYEYAVFTANGLLYKNDGNIAPELSYSGTRQKAKQRLVEVLQKDLQKNLLK